MLKKFNRLTTNIRNGVTRLLGGSFGQNLGSSIEKLNNIRVVTDSDIRIHAPELLQAASEISLAMRNIRITAGVDAETRRVCGDVLASADAMTRVVEEFGQNLENGFTNFGINQFKSTVDTIFIQFNSYLKVALCMAVSVCVVHITEKWARSALAVFFLTVFLCHSFIFSVDPTDGDIRRDSPPQNMVSPSEVVNEVPSIPPSAMDPLRQTSCALIDTLQRTSITAPTHIREWEPHCISFHSGNAFHPADGAYDNTYVIIDLEAVYECDKFELASVYSYDYRVTLFEIYYKVNVNDEYTVLSPRNMSGATVFLGLEGHTQHKFYQNFSPFTARYVKIVPRAYVKVPTIKFQIHGVRKSSPNSQLM